MSIKNSKVIRTLLKWKTPLVAAAALLLLAAAFIILYNGVFRALRLEYTITPESDNTVTVNMRIYRNTYFSPTEIRLGKGLFEPAGYVCADDKNNPVTIVDDEDSIILGSVGNTARYINFSYKPLIREYNGEPEHGVSTENFIARDGEHLLYFPFFSYEEGEHLTMADRISRIDITADVRAGWMSVVPYGQAKEGPQTVSIKKPSWKICYDLGKSCYAFGLMRKVSVRTESGNLELLACSETEDLSPQACEVIGSLFGYYEGLFRGPLADCPVILLPRRDDGNMNFAGIGGKATGISAPSGDKAEIGTFSHSIYTTFFENNFSNADLHYPPNLWLYKGLASYYETVSMDYLPQPLKDERGISSESIFRELFGRYIYMGLKEPATYRVTPAEEKEMMPAQQQFYFYTEAPLIVRTIEGMGRVSKGRQDGVLSYLLENAGREHISMADLMVSVVGEEEARIRGYLACEELMPYPGKALNGIEDTELIIEQLDAYEQRLCSYMQLEFPQYVYEKLYLIDVDKLADECLAKDVRFGTDMEELIVSDFSPTLFMLLKQHKLRAMVCGYDDLTDPMLRFHLLYDMDNLEKWERYMRELGVNG